MNETTDKPAKPLSAYDPSCSYCVKYGHPTKLVMMPNHTASSRCQSGGRAHCTCDACF